MKGLSYPPKLCATAQPIIGWRDLSWATGRGKRWLTQVDQMATRGAFTQAHVRSLAFYLCDPNINGCMYWDHSINNQIYMLKSRSIKNNCNFLVFIWKNPWNAGPFYVASITMLLQFYSYSCNIWPGSHFCNQFSQFDQVDTIESTWSNQINCKNGFLTKF